MSSQMLEGLVRDLAKKHFDLEEGIEKIVWFQDGEQNEVHLLEINRNTIPEGAILTFYLRPSRERPFPVIIGDVTPTEWEKVKDGSIALPDGWTLRKAVVFERNELLESTS